MTAPSGPTPAEREALAMWRDADQKVQVPNEARDRYPTPAACYLDVRLRSMTKAGGRAPYPSQATLMGYFGLDPQSHPRTIQRVTAQLRGAGLIRTEPDPQYPSLCYHHLVLPPVKGDGVRYGEVPFRLLVLIEDHSSPLKPMHVMTWLYLWACFGNRGWTKATIHEIAELAQKARPGLRGLSPATVKRHVRHLTATGLLEHRSRPGIGWVLALPGCMPPEAKSGEQVGSKVAGHRGQKWRVGGVKSGGSVGSKVTTELPVRTTSSVTTSSGINRGEAGRPAQAVGGGGDELSGQNPVDSNSETSPARLGLNADPGATRGELVGDASAGRPKSDLEIPEARLPVGMRGRAGGVLTALPAELGALLRKKYGDRLPSRLQERVEEQLATRTVEQLRERIHRRWPRYETDAAHGRIGSPLGVALALLEAPSCPDTRCEDGELLDDQDGYTRGRCPYCYPWPTSTRRVAGLTAVAANFRAQDLRTAAAATADPGDQAALLREAEEIERAAEPMRIIAAVDKRRGKAARRVEGGAALVERMRLLDEAEANGNVQAGHLQAFGVSEAPPPLTLPAVTSSATSQPASQSSDSVGTGAAAADWPGPNHTAQCGHGERRGCRACPFCRRGKPIDAAGTPCAGCPPGGMP